jgi:hypothetical protein
MSKHRLTQISIFSPTRHTHAGDLALVRQLAEVNSAQAELPVHGAGPTAQVAAGFDPAAELGLAFRFGDFGFTCHRGFP